MLSVYVLYHNDVPIYIGLSEYPKQRLMSHKYKLKNKSLTMDIIDESDCFVRDFKEELYIGLFSTWGFGLLNIVKNFKHTTSLKKIRNARSLKRLAIIKNKQNELKEN